MDVIIRTIYQIKSRYFVAGIMVDICGRVYACAPILKYLCNRNIADVHKYINKKGWQMTKVEEK